VYTILVHEGSAGLGGAGTADVMQRFEDAARRAEEIAGTDYELVVEIYDGGTGEKVVLDKSEDPKEGPFYG
jgi:hypothetical protein